MSGLYDKIDWRVGILIPMFHFNFTEELKNTKQKLTYPNPIRNIEMALPKTDATIIGTRCNPPRTWNMFYNKVML